MLTLSKTPPTGGFINKSPEGFVVKEITKNGTVLESGIMYNPQALGEEEESEGKFAAVILEKTNWNTVDALRALAKRFGRGMKSISYAGMKDRSSHSVQLAAIFGADPKQISQIKIKDIKLNGAWKRGTAVELGDLLGNAFEVEIKDLDDKNMEKAVNGLSGIFPNYFDRQRFGSRLNNASVGLRIIKGEFEEAVLDFLTSTENEKNEDSVTARNKLKEDADYKKALEYFPRYLRNERTVIEYICRYQNFANAIRKLPRGINMMFIHSVQNLIFNAEIERRIKEKDLELKGNLGCTKNFYGFPSIEDTSIGNPDNSFLVGNLIGYETKNESINEYEKELLEKLGVKKEEFKIKSMPELSMRGSSRALFAPFRDFKYKGEDKDALLKFSIPSGSYATIFINEITKSDNLTLNILSKGLLQ